MKEILAVINIVGFIVISVLVLIAAKYGSEWAAKMMDTIVPMIIQAWVLNFTMMIGYYFGSSNAESKRVEQETKKEDAIIELTKPVQ